MDITNEEVHKKGVQRVSKYSRKKIIWISSTVIIVAVLIGVLSFVLYRVFRTTDDPATNDSFTSTTNFATSTSTSSATESSTSSTISSTTSSNDERKSEGLLYPRESETREVRTLDGMWKFAQSERRSPNQGLTEEWFLKDLSESRSVINMPVPSSYNDILEDDKLRDHVGTVWYERKFFVAKLWETQRVWIRFGSVHYEAQVWINGEFVVRHSIGHLPFEAEITNHLNFGQENRITVVCDNTLTQTTIPQGNVVEKEVDGGTEIIQEYSFDFFNYAGIHRSVHLYTTPLTYIKEVVIIDTTIDNNENGHVSFRIATNDESTTTYATVLIYDKEEKLVVTHPVDESFSGEAVISNVRKWWPYLMDPKPGYLYTMEVRLSTSAQEIIDIYRMKFGVRTLRWTNTSFLINEKPIYFRGFGKHEDSDFRGKGLDNALLAKDFNLLRWVGANAYRTSHYPYSEESMQFADEHGIMIVDEVPAVNARDYNDGLLETHKRSIDELIHRDRSHPSVVMWSIANEARTEQMNTEKYFAEVALYTKSLDAFRPITQAIDAVWDEDLAAQFLDIISINRYHAWYYNEGHLDMVTSNVIREATAYHEKHSKPVLMSEYGSDTLEGLHIMPAFVWSEEFQTQHFSKHFDAFDQLRNKGFFIGEFVWNFADFKTGQTHPRVGGNKKGVFTRNRQPKASAHLLRQRYFWLASEIDNYQEQPIDLYIYTSQNQKENQRDEL